ncbi:hypothetical protein KUF71_013554 [Frankliniella fusca]|uniref:Uncharacterized protein n=1 Tax=Frankliniella fusca TaxID=407009 RepID=A0AAE1HQ18_9NEOP|nr:hypothetical protein KUF71_013554 [Frankliniella fusca]
MASQGEPKPEPEASREYPYTRGWCWGARGAVRAAAGAGRTAGLPMALASDTVSGSAAFRVSGSTRVTQAAAKHVTASTRSGMPQKKTSSSGSCGASTDPILPTVEHSPIMEWRALVGNSSAVNTYSTVKVVVMDSLAVRYSASRSGSRPASSEPLVTPSELLTQPRRPQRSDSAQATTYEGISTSPARMKLRYRSPASATENSASPKYTNAVTILSTRATRSSQRQSRCHQATAPSAAHPSEKKEATSELPMTRCRPATSSTPATTRPGESGAGEEDEDGAVQAGREERVDEGEGEEGVVGGDEGARDAGGERQRHGDEQQGAPAEAVREHAAERHADQLAEEVEGADDRQLPAVLLAGDLELRRITARITRSLTAESYAPRTKLSIPKSTLFHKTTVSSPQPETSSVRITASDEAT